MWASQPSIPFLPPAYHLLLLVLFPLASCLTLSELRHRSIYQVLTDRFARPDDHLAPCDLARKSYCGGTWKGIERKLGYIQGMGFDTVWISPVVLNVELEEDTAYHGYWATDINELNSHFGTKQDLLDLSAALHERGMYLMVDVVANHLGTESQHTFLPGEMYGPFTSPAHFHPYCVPSDWNDQIQVEQCWLDHHMPDLNTESAYVVRALHTWIRNLVRTYNIDTIRVDTVKHVRKDFWPDFVREAGVAAMGEVLHGDPAYLGAYQRESMSSLLDFATFFHLRRAFESTSGSIAELFQMIGHVHRLLPDPTALGSFLDNHDFPRLAGSASDPVLVKNAAVYPFVNDGFPIVYMGQEHGLMGGEDPFNREAIWLQGYHQTSELYKMFRILNAARRSAVTSHPPYLTTLMRAHQPNNNTIALTKAPLLSVLTNYGATVPAIVLHLAPGQTGYKPLIPVIDVLTEQIFATDPRGGLTVPIVGGQPRVFLPLAVHRGAASKSVWQGSALVKVDTSVAQDSKGHSTPGGSHRKTPSFGRVLSWLGSVGQSKNSDL